MGIEQQHELQQAFDVHSDSPRCGQLINRQQNISRTYCSYSYACMAHVLFLSSFLYIVHLSKYHRYHISDTIHRYNPHHIAYMQHNWYMPFSPACVCRRGRGCSQWNCEMIMNGM